jgi:hypothetical protein
MQSGLWKSVHDFRLFKLGINVSFTADQIFPSHWLEEATQGFSLAELRSFQNARGPDIA